MASVDDVLADYIKMPVAPAPDYADARDRRLLGAVLLAELTDCLAAGRSWGEYQEELQVIGLEYDIMWGPATRRLQPELRIEMLLQATEIMRVESNHPLFEALLQRANDLLRLRLRSLEQDMTALADAGKDGGRKTDGEAHRINITLECSDMLRDLLMQTDTRFHRQADATKQARAIIVSLVGKGMIKDEDWTEWVRWRRITLKGTGKRVERLERDRMFVHLGKPVSLEEMKTHITSLLAPLYARIKKNM